MDRPTQVVVGVNTYRIFYTKKKWGKYAPNKNPDDYAGLTLDESCVILIAAWRLSGTAIRDTLVHEILHTLFALHSFGNMPGELPSEKHDVEELIILLLTPHLLQVLMDNPEVIEWLTG